MRDVQLRQGCDYHVNARKFHNSVRDHMKVPASGAVLGDEEKRAMHAVIDRGWLIGVLHFVIDGSHDG